jgi:hypothetical protein
MAIPSVKTATSDPAASCARRSPRRATGSAPPPDIVTPLDQGFDANPDALEPVDAGVVGRGYNQSLRRNVTYRPKEMMTISRLEATKPEVRPKPG